MSSIITSVLRLVALLSNILVIYPVSIAWAILDHLRENPSPPSSNSQEDTHGHSFDVPPVTSSFHKRCVSLSALRCATRISPQETLPLRFLSASYSYPETLAPLVVPPAVPLALPSSPPLAPIPAPVSRPGLSPSTAPAFPLSPQPVLAQSPPPSLAPSSLDPPSKEPAPVMPSTIGVLPLPVKVKASLPAPTRAPSSRRIPKDNEPITSNSERRARKRHAASLQRTKGTRPVVGIVSAFRSKNKTQ